MRAAVFLAPQTATIEEVPLPEPKGATVRVRLEGCGVCGSNLPIWEGRPWFTYPRTAGQPGHEGWGVVDAIGSDVKNVRVGTRAALLSCQSFAEYDLAHESMIVPLSELPGDKPFPGEALGCAVNVFRRSKIRAGDQVAIIGIGFLGAVITALAAEAGARVIALSRRDFALRIAKIYGASETIPLLDHAEIIERVKRITQGELCDVVIEAAGQQWPLDLAAELVKESGRLVIAGYHQDGLRSVNMQLWNWRGLDVVNAHERNPNVNHEGVRLAANYVASGRFDPTPLYTHQFPLTRISDALETMRQRPDRFLKALITL
jgi:threonine dehydrogenase-like Zn-dependent dehydrogenase